MSVRRIPADPKQGHASTFDEPVYSLKGISILIATSLVLAAVIIK